MFIKETLSFQDFGSRIAVSITGESAEAVKHRFYSFWNHGATNGEFEWIDNISGYFWSTKEDLHKSLVGAALFNLLNNNPLEFKGKKFGALPKAREIAAEIFNNLNKTKIVNIAPIENNIFKTHIDLEKIV